jgi:hypothetical protein
MSFGRPFGAVSALEDEQVRCSNVDSARVRSRSKSSRAFQAVVVSTSSRVTSQQS